MIGFDTITLDNGTKVILHQDTDTPLVAFNVLFPAGSKFDPAYKSGLAHLLEHLMFSGTPLVPDYDRPLQLAGSENNAFTNNDYANYYCYGPSSNLETLIWVDADRLANLQISQEAFDIQQQVVTEELYETCLNIPYGDSWHHLLPAIYKKHPYRWPTIGISAEEIANITLDDILQFKKNHYHVRHSAITLSGNFDPHQAEDLLGETFGQMNGTPGMISKFEFSLDDYTPSKIHLPANVPVSAFHIAFPMPDRTHPDYYALDMFSDLLAMGRSSLLYRRLVKELQILSNVDAYITGTIDTGLFVIEGRLAPGISLDEATKRIWELLHSIYIQGVDERAMEKLKNTLESTMVFSEMSTLNKAINLSYYSYVDTPDLINKELDIYHEIEGSEILSAAQKYLHPEQATILHYEAHPV